MGVCKNLLRDRRCRWTGRGRRRGRCRYRWWLRRRSGCRRRLRGPFGNRIGSRRGRGRSNGRRRRNRRNRIGPQYRRLPRRLWCIDLDRFLGGFRPAIARRFAALGFAVLAFGGLARRFDVLGRLALGRLIPGGIRLGGISLGRVRFSSVGLGSVRLGGIGLGGIGLGYVLQRPFLAVLRYRACRASTCGRPGRARLPIEPGHHLPAWRRRAPLPVAPAACGPCGRPVAKIHRHPAW